jgi:hypothetical protein
MARIAAIQRKEILNQANEDNTDISFEHQNFPITRTEYSTPGWKNPDHEDHLNPRRRPQDLQRNTDTDIIIFFCKQDKLNKILLRY